MSSTRKSTYSVDDPAWIFQDASDMTDSLLEILSHPDILGSVMMISPAGYGVHLTAGGTWTEFGKTWLPSHWPSVY